jgi:hypothetical protein
MRIPLNSSSFWRGDGYFVISCCIVSIKLRPFFSSRQNYELSGEGGCFSSIPMWFLSYHPPPPISCRANKSCGNIFTYTMHIMHFHSHIKIYIYQQLFYFVLYFLWETL